MKTVEMDIGVLELCDRTRVRKLKPNINGETVDEYAEAYRSGLIVEPLDVFREKGTERYVVADGEHRLLAMQRAKIKKATVRLHEGDEIAALDFAIGCNHAHGLRRTKQDKQHAFARIMETPLKEKYRTDTALSEKIGVSLRTIADYKVDWRNSESGDRETRRKKEHAREQAEKHASSAPARTKVNGKKQDVAAQPPKETKKADKPAEPAWTAEDDHGYALLKSAWRQASQPARDKFMAEYA